MRSKINEDLIKLREQIAELDTTDGETKAKLELLVAGIENQLESTENDSDDLRGQLEQTISHFETTHPTITGVLNRIMVALGNMGV